MKLIQNPETIRKLAQSSGYREQFSVEVLEDSRLFFFHSGEYIVKEGAAPEYLNAEVMTISAIMTLVPGVTFTTAIRDTLNGDYGAGSARMLEAIVVALAVSAGVGCGLLLYRAI